MQASESLTVGEAEGGRRFSCSRCDHDLGPLTENYKLSCLLQETPVGEGNPHIRDPHLYVDADIVLRRYFCPGCGVLVETEVAERTDPPLWDIELSA